ncbi:major facilitator superfamily domain-containing protein [Trichoderma breve]|uniref:Major facilitator superfamily domain-containing protein n=1 Tax=Trichoderma breve TaxID=2034170 RepID=A0A9W9E676_9HYPO|nr:major facilitator superfamily domain-containing protein [Trichoderma breve]KAJ4858067.1 major facilitator superfamily domain-containing protein [Trichoderma breve]
MSAADLSPQRVRTSGSAEEIKIKETEHIEYERNELLARLTDPDEGKSEEEKQEIDRKLMWKVDLWLVPWLSLLYLLSFLDRTNIGNARLAHIEADLGMKGNNYNMILTIFFISYAVAEPVTNALLKRLTPRIFFTSIILTWGIIMTLMGLTTSYRGLLAARFFLGAAEAGLFPGVNYYLSCWYKSSEIGVRSAIFLSAAAIAGSFGGLLAAAITKMDGIGGKPGWAWIFIIEGLATVLVAKFLTPEERIRVQRRLIVDRQGYTADDFDKRYIYEAIRDWKTYGYTWIFIGCTIPLYAFSLFLPTIIAAMGHSGTRAQLLTVPPYVCAAVLTVLIGFFADKMKWRGYCSLAAATLGIVGFALLLGSSRPNIQYAGTFLGAMGIYPAIPNTLSWVSNNTEGSLKRAIVLGIVVGFGNLNGIVSSNIYLPAQKPRYPTGHGVVLASQIFFLLGGSVFMHFALRAENSRRHRNMGDKRPDFVYTL